MIRHIFRVPVDKAHFEDTIARGKCYAQVLPFLTASDKEHVPALTDNSGKLRYWGSLPGMNNLKTFKQIEKGDDLLFYRSGKYIAVAAIGYVTVNAELARYSWGETANQATWELVYFLRDVILLSIETGVLNEQWGLKPGHVMGFSKLSDERAQPFLSKYGSVATFLSQTAANNQDEKAA